MNPIYDIFLELTNICNFHCPFCPYDQMERNKGLMKKETAFQAIKQISQENISSRIALFLMGESLLHPDFFSIAEEVHKNGLYGLLHTNALLFNKKIRKKLLDSPLNEINISLETFGEEAFSRKYRGKNFTFNQYMERILLFLKEHFQNQSKQVIKIHFFSKSWLTFFKGKELNEFLTEDFKNIYHYFATWCQNNISHKLVIRKLPFSFNQEYNIELLPNIHLVSRQIQSFGGAKGEKKTYKAKFGSCNAVRDQLGILWDGTVVPCCVDYEGKIKLGNINQKSLLEIIHSPLAVKLVDHFKKGRVLHPVCQTCRGGSSLWRSWIKQAASWIQSKKIIDFSSKKQV